MTWELEPKGEPLRRAVRWIGEERSVRPAGDVARIVDEAGMRFDLGPLEQQFLWQAFVVQAPPRPTGVAMRYRRILCAVDLSEPSRVAMRHAADLAAASGARLTLLHVGPQESLAAWKDEAEKRGAQVETVVVDGVPWERIVELARDHDLTVIGTHGRVGLARAFLGSVAEKVVRNAPGPVLVVP